MLRLGADVEVRAPAGARLAAVLVPFVGGLRFALCVRAAAISEPYFRALTAGPFSAYRFSPCQTDAMSLSAPSPLVAVLAGGRGERLDGRKPSVMLADRPLISYPLEAARAAGLEAVVVAKPDTVLPPLEERIIYDTERTYHPLAGVLAALTIAPSVIAIACDMPFVPPALLRFLAEQPGQTVVTRPGSFLQPFPALYRAKQARALQAALLTERSLQDSIDRLRPQIIDERELQAFGHQIRIYYSVNTPGDLVTAEGWMRSQDRAAAG